MTEIVESEVMLKLKKIQEDKKRGKVIEDQIQSAAQTKTEKPTKNPLDESNENDLDMEKTANASFASGIGKKLYSANQKTFFSTSSATQQDMTNLANMISGVAPTYGVRMKNQAMKQEESW